MLKISKISTSVARAFALVGFAGLLVLALMTTLDVVLRWMFQMPIQGVNDVSSVVMAVVIAVCIPANLAMKQNINVEIFGTVAGPKVKAALDTFASFLTLIFIALIAWQFVPYAHSLYETGDRTWVLGWPVWPWWSVAALMMWLSAFVQLFVFIQDLQVLMFGERAVTAVKPTGLD
jgi:TRAP-type C4-dicarboxylate transport system permease small subunit